VFGSKLAKFYLIGIKDRLIGYALTNNFMEQKFIFENKDLP